MAVTVYRSTDSSAPVLSGSAGALVAVLDACLRTGYGSKTGAGWTKPYTGTNAASFRQGGGNQFYLEVNDNGPGAGTYKEARAVGYEVMTASATGTGLFPTVAQQATNLFIRKSTTADSAARAWTLVADDRTFYLFIQSADTAAQWFCFAFGDFYSYLSPGTDGFRTMIIGRITENSAAGTSERSDVTTLLANAITGHFIARSYTQAGTSITWGKMGDYSKAGGSTVTNGSMSIPNIDGRVWISPLFVTETVSVVRGKVRGLMHLLHLPSTFNDQDTVTGAGPYAGHTFLLFKTTVGSATYCIDITGPWDTN